MKRTPIWFWVCIAYLLATLTYNVWMNWHTFRFFTSAIQIIIDINLGAKAIAVPLLLFRRAEGVYLLAVAFIVGTGGFVWDFYQFSDWGTLPLVNKIGTIDGIVISLAIVIYLTLFFRKHLPIAETVQDVFL